MRPIHTILKSPVVDGGLRDLGVWGAGSAWL
jgi:hypothetical protein